MIKVKASQKIFTDTETATLTGIGLERRAAEAAGRQAEQWLFTRSDLMVLAMLYHHC